MAPEITGKRLELLKEAVPGLSRVALLLDTGNPRRHVQLHDHEIATRELGVQLLPLEVHGPDEFVGAFQTAIQGHVQALIIQGSPLFGTHQARLVELALASRLPTIGVGGEYAQAGGLMTYGPSLSDIYRRAAIYVDKILKGAKPADLRHGSDHAADADLPGGRGHPLSPGSVTKLLQGGEGKWGDAPDMLGDSGRWDQSPSS